MLLLLEHIRTHLKTNAKGAADSSANTRAMHYKGSNRKHTWCKYYFILH